MRADKIPDIIRQLNNINSPYQCVMISGERWIGKFLQISAEIHTLKPAGSCPLFGIDNVDDIPENNLLMRA